jgi:hypothetical protein
MSLPEGTNLVASARVQLAKLEEQRPLTPGGELLRELFVEASKGVTFQNRRRSRRRQ